MASRSTTLFLSPPPPPKAPGPPAAHFRAVRVLTSTPMCSETLCFPRRILVSDDKLRASLVVVRMNINTAVLRSEFEDLDAQDEVLSAQFSGDAATSWICTRPAFGPTVSQFGVAVKGIPDWMLGHILLGVLGQVVDGKDVKVDDVVLDGRPQEEGTYEYRGYPVIWVELREAWVEEATARSVLKLMRDLIVGWSDVAGYIDAANRVGQQELITDEPVLLLLHDVVELLKTDVEDMAEVVDELKGRLRDIRHEGPMKLPEKMVQKLHLELVTEEEVKWAFREPTVFKFTWHFEKVQAIVTDQKVCMGRGGFAGMKTKRILVVRFGEKEAFSRIVREGGYADTEAEADDELTIPEGESEDGQFEWDDEMKMD
jgi:hypothetical protein